MEVLVLIIPFLTAAAFWTAKTKRNLHIINSIGSIFLLILATWITFRIMTAGTIGYPLLNHFFYVDALSVIVLDTIIIVSFMVSIYAIGYLNREHQYQVFDLKRIKIFYSLMYFLIFTMILVETTQNLGLMWIAIEATTLASAFLVGFYNKKESVEAAWKYVIICSVGIALALLGIVFINISAVSIFEGSKSTLNWLFLLKHAPRLQGSILKIAFLFILVGFGTKAGLVPMHTWLPDAYSEAPSPISALLAGGLINCSMYGLIRILIIVNKSLGSSLFTGRLLMIIGILSIGTAAVFILTQKDYKRLLAYSSIEHMGVIAVGLGIFTPFALFTVLYHMINHAFTKSLLFLASGNVHMKFKTRQISKVTGVLKTMPITGVLFLLGLFAIAGTPPFSIFSSELSMIIALFTTNRLWQGAIFALLIAIVFTGIAMTALKMFFGDNHDPTMDVGEVNQIGLPAIFTLLLIISIMGVYLPGPLKTLLESAASIVKGNV